MTILEIIKKARDVYTLVTGTSGWVVKVKAIYELVGLLLPLLPDDSPHIMGASATSFANLVEAEASLSGIEHDARLAQANEAGAIGDGKIAAALLKWALRLLPLLLL